MTLIYVGNLSDDTDAARTRSIFERFGTISSLRVTPGGSGRRFDGFGLVEMEESAAREAIAALDGLVLDGAILSVREATEQERPAPRPAPVPSLEEDRSVRGIMRQRYEVAEVEKAVNPGGRDGDDWYRYVLASGDARITGFHRGTESEVAEYAAECAEAFNERAIRGRSTRAMAPPRKK